MASLVQYSKYGTIDAYETSKYGYYFIKLILKSYTIQNNTTVDGKITTTGKLVGKAKYI